MKTHILRVPKGEDLLPWIENFCVENEIKTGWITGIGGVEKLVFGYFDKEKKQYVSLERNEFLEVLTLNGNVSLKDGKPFVHLHITCADESGEAFGGHLMPGTSVFIAEIKIEESDEILGRKPDAETGLGLWEV